MRLFTPFGYHNEARTAPMPGVQTVRIKWVFDCQSLELFDFSDNPWKVDRRCWAVGGIYVYIFNKTSMVKMIPDWGDDLHVVRFFADAGQTELLGTSFHWFPCWRPWSYRIPTDHYLQHNSTLLLRHFSNVLGISRWSLQSRVVSIHVQIHRSHFPVMADRQ